MVLEGREARRKTREAGAVVSDLVIGLLLDGEYRGQPGKPPGAVAEDSLLSLTCAAADAWWR